MKRDFTARPLKVFASYYKPHWRLFLLDMVCATLVSATDLAFPFVTKLGLERFLPQGLYKTFFLVMAVLAGAYVVRGILQYVITYWGHLLGVRIEADMRADIFGHIQSQSFHFFDHNRTGQLMSRITTDLFDITELAHHGPEDLFMSVLTLGGAFVVLLTIRWELALILFAVVPIFLVFSVLQRGRMRRASIAVKQRMAGINAQVEGSISGVRTAKAFTNEQAEAAKFRRSNDDFKTAKGSYYRAMGIFFSGTEFTLAILQVITIAAGGWFIMEGRMSYVDVLTFSLYVSTFVTPIRKLNSFIEMYMQGIAGFGRFLEVMNTAPDLKDPPDARELGPVKGDVAFSHVSFAYEPGAPAVLRDVSLRIPAGSCLGVVGSSGGGKTTLCQLLPRFYDVSAGSVTIDGTDVRAVTQASLRRQIGILQQDVFLFADTIRENIRYGRPGATDAEVEQAARLAEIHEDILAMPAGYDTYVGERGVLLSGGQKQRISIARVFLKDPPILILDEATSALDSVTEQRIQASLEQLRKGRTSIIIAHRLSTIRGADHIAVIEDARVAEYGTYAELMARDGIFAALVRAQEQ
jgi:ATP-binding cassette subfamily B protein